MSAAVIGIAIAHSIPIIAVGYFTKSKYALAISLFIMCGIGVSTGNPMYASSDIAGSLLGFVIGNSFLEEECTIKDILKIAKIIIGVGILAAIILVKYG